MTRDLKQLAAKLSEEILNHKGLNPQIDRDGLAEFLIGKRVELEKSGLLSDQDFKIWPKLFGKVLS
jgi:hypothetical protein